MAESLQIVSVTFHEDTLEAVQDAAGKVWVILRRACDVLGVDLKGQSRRLQDKNSCPWACVVTMSIHDTTGRKQESLLIDLDTLPMWLATIDGSRVKDEVKPKLAIYQRECARVLRDHFYGTKQSLIEEPGLIVDNGDPIIHSLVLIQSALVAIRKLREQQIELEKRTNEARSLAQLAALRADAAVALHNSNHGQFSVLGWIRLQGRTIDVQAASVHGRKLSAICRQAGIEPGNVTDPRFGIVNTYPEGVLEEYFGPIPR